MAKMTKVVKVPVRIEEDDDVLRHVKYRALYKTMEEARNLGNLAIRYAIAFSLEDIPPEYDQNGKKVPLDTSIYRKLSQKRQFLNSANVATLGRNFAVKTFRNHSKDAWQGKKSLPTYKSIFVPFRHTGTKIDEVVKDGSQSQFIIRPQGFGTKWLSDELIKLVDIKDVEGENISNDQRKLVLKSKFSWKDKGSVDIVRRIVSGEYKMSDSQIQKCKQKGLTVFLTYKHDAERQKLDPNKVCGVDLGVVIPAVCATSFSPQRRYLGDGNDVWAARSKFRAERRRQQKRQGQQSKGRNWKRSSKEDRWIHSYHHTLTRQVIKFCEQFGCGTIHVEDLTNLRQKEVKTEYRRLLWVPSKFYDLLSYKAEEKGIEIVKVNRRNTSKRCSVCGYISRSNRKSQSQFVCEQCGDPKKPINADYNAARNLALAEGDVIKDGYLDKGQSSNNFSKEIYVLWEESQEG